MVEYERDGDEYANHFPIKMAYAKAHAYKDGFIGLMAAKGMESFYTQYGFFARPTTNYGPGMMLFWQ